MRKTLPLACCNRGAQDLLQDLTELSNDQTFEDPDLFGLPFEDFFFEWLRWATDDNEPSGTTSQASGLDTESVESPSKDVLGLLLRYRSARPYKPKQGFDTLDRRWTTSALIDCDRGQPTSTEAPFSNLTGP